MNGMQAAFRNSQVYSSFNTRATASRGGTLNNATLDPAANAEAARSNVPYMMAQRQAARLHLTPQAREQQAATRFAQPLGYFDTDGTPGYAYGEPVNRLRVRAGALSLSRRNGANGQTAPRGSSAASTAPGMGILAAQTGEDIEGGNARTAQIGVDGAGDAESADTANGATVEADEAAAEESGETSGVERQTADEMTRPRGADGEPLSDGEMRMLRKLEQRDAEIRAHEQAHLAASGGLARGSANFSYTTGPDGKRYATGGEVSIDASPESTPEETLRKMDRVRAAAMAPANPSAQDRRVASMASQRSNAARQEIVELQIEENRAEREQRAAESEESPEPETADTEGGAMTQNAAAAETESPLAGVAGEASASAGAAASASIVSSSLNGDDGMQTASAAVHSATTATERAQSASFSAVEDAAERARRFAGVRAYIQSRRVEPLKPDTRAAQPGPPRSSSVGVLPTLRPPHGSAADIIILGR